MTEPQVQFMLCLYVPDKSCRFHNNGRANNPTFYLYFDFLPQSDGTTLHNAISPLQVSGQLNVYSDGMLFGGPGFECRQGQDTSLLDSVETGFGPHPP